ncbi:MAG: hypothetical protein IT211_03275 [Armatimonadetes bacterium]|nr:hypothetical protein [Armatimonadota bacterium]
MPVYVRIIILIALAIATVGCRNSSAPPQLLDGVLCHTINAAGEPLDRTKEFSSMDSAIRCVLIFQQSEGIAQIRGKWSADRVPGVQHGTTVGEVAVKSAPNSKYVTLSLTPTSPLPAGNYLLEIFIDSDGKAKPQPDQTLAFTVVSKGAQITNSFLASDPQGKQRSDAFPLRTSVVYAHLKLANVPPKTTLTASWVQDGNGEIDRVPITLRRGEESVVFILTLQDGLAAGNYHVLFFFNNQTTPALTLPFQATSQ